VRFIFLIILFISSLFSKQCADQYNPEKFLDAPDRFGEIIDANLKNIKLFASVKEYLKLHFKKMKICDKIYFVKKNSFIKKGDYIYPVKSGLWKYHINKYTKIDEIDIADVYNYKDSIGSVSDEINSDFEGLWRRSGGSAYEAKLLPEDTQIRFGKKYIALSVYLYGLRDDSTELNTTVVDYHILNYTREVDKFMECSEKNKKKDILE